MSSDRPQPKAKRQAGGQLTKDNVVLDDDDEGSVDPGTWRPAGEIKGRKKVHVRRQGATAADTAMPAVASSNPFAGITLAAPSAEPAAANPFAGINLVPPTSTASEPAKVSGNGNNEQESAPMTLGTEATELASQPTSNEPTTMVTSQQAEEETAKEAAKDGAEKPETDSKAAEAAPSGGFGALAAASGSSNPFANLSSKPFGGGFGAATGGFGALGAIGTTFGFGSTEKGTAAAGGFGAAGNSFNFGTGAFPPITALPLGSGAAAFKSASDTGNEQGENEEAGEGDEEGGAGGDGVALFGNAAVQPVVSLPEQERRTGEESEKTIFTADGALFEFDAAASRWRERGRGEFKVNVTPGKDGTPSEARMVMRQAANLRLLLNAKVHAGMPLAVMPSTVGVTFGVVNGAATSTNEGGKDTKDGADNTASKADDANAVAAMKATTWAIKIKNSEKVQSLYDMLQQFKSPLESTTDDVHSGSGTQPIGDTAV